MGNELKELHVTAIRKEELKKKRNKFKVGDIVIGNEEANSQYTIAKKGYKGKVTDIYPSGKIELDDRYLVEPECFDLFSGAKPELTHYIINKGATILFWNDDTKTVVKRKSDDEFNKQLGFLTAYFQKISGMSRNKANKFLADLKVQEPEKK